MAHTRFGGFYYVKLRIKFLFKFLSTLSSYHSSSVAIAAAAVALYQPFTLLLSHKIRTEQRISMRCSKKPPFSRNLCSFIQSLSFDGWWCIGKMTLTSNYKQFSVEWNEKSKLCTEPIHIQCVCLRQLYRSNSPLKPSYSSFESDNFYDNRIYAHSKRNDNNLIPHESFALIWTGTCFKSDSTRFWKHRTRVYRFGFAILNICISSHDEYSPLFK